MPELSDRVGEVIEASTTDFVAECYQLYELPPLGSLVSVGDTSAETFGIVYHATTTSVDPGRRPIARGKDAASEAEIYQSSPQLLQLLRSEFCVLAVGHRLDGRLYHYLPPQPARVHSFVHLCLPQEVQNFSQSFAFLNILVNAHLPVPADELIAACLRQMSQTHEDRHSFLVAAGKELAVMLSGQFDKLKAILERIKVE